MPDCPGSSGRSTLSCTRRFSLRVYLNPVLSLFKTILRVLLAVRDPLDHTDHDGAAHDVVHFVQVQFVHVIHCIYLLVLCLLSVMQDPVWVLTTGYTHGLLQMAVFLKNFGGFCG